MAMCISNPSLCRVEKGPLESASHQPSSRLRDPISKEQGKAWYSRTPNIFHWPPHMCLCTHTPHTHIRASNKYLIQCLAHNP